jgi:transcriptional regulator with XRE-family HTH domain
MQVERRNLTVDEWEEAFGEQVRRLRLSRNIDQATLAELADISVGAVSNLERGKGSSLKTLVAILRALDRTDWLESLAPAVAVSPMQMLRAKQKEPQQRMRATSRGRREAGG